MLNNQLCCIINELPWCSHGIDHYSHDIFRNNHGAQSHARYSHDECLEIGMCQSTRNLCESFYTTQTIAKGQHIVYVRLLTIQPVACLSSIYYRTYNFIIIISLCDHNCSLYHFSSLEVLEKTFSFCSIQIHLHENHFHGCYGTQN